MPQLLTKPLSWFHRDPGQPRKSFDEQADRALGASMLSVGTLQPLGAKPDGTLLWGERRYRAAELVGIKELSVIVTDKTLTASEIRIIQLTENLHRADLSGFERWRASAELMGMNPHWQMKDLADHLKVDPSMVTRLLSPSKCIVPVQDALKAGRLGISDCYAISKLPESEQAAILARKLDGASRDELDRHVRKQRNGTPAVRMERIKCPLPSGVVVQVSGHEISLDDMIEALGELLKAAKKSSQDGLDCRTFERVCKDKAKAK